MPLKVEDHLDVKYYVYIRRLLTIVGLWPYLKISKRLPCVSFISIIMALVINLQIYLILTAEQKIEPIAKYIQTILPTIVAAAAYWNLLCNSALVKETFERVQSDWKKLICEDELSVMQKYTVQSKVRSHSIACAFFLYITILIIPAIIRFFQFTLGIVNKNKLVLPVYADIFVETQLRYYLMLTLEVVAILTTYTIGMAHYIMYISLLQHACALFVIVRNKIDRPFIKDDYKLRWTQILPKHEVEFNWIVIVIKNYNDAMKFVDLITSLYGKIYIVELTAYFCVVIVDFIYLFQLLNFVIPTVEALKIILYMNATLLIVYGYFYLGERLMEHSSSVYANCLLVPFYTLSVQTNKIFLLLIMRSLKPCSISIKGTAVASHELFAKIIKASFSFATVCYNVR